ncbi:MAG TPA: RHS repeat domain-containing protein [Pyrinomonadaceae bacterium]|nr:RHS repeat domain-containing protein [Pyrinomonadaceae bacterium]
MTKLILFILLPVSANQNFPHSYDDVNRLTARSAPNGVTSSYTYDGLRRLTALNHSTGAGTLIGNQYQYNRITASQAISTGNLPAPFDY